MSIYSLHCCFLLDLSNRDLIS